MNETANNIRPARLAGKRYDATLVALAVAWLVAASLLLTACSTFDRTRDPETGIVSPSRAEQVIAAATAAAAAVPLNPYTKIFEIGFGLLGGIAAGYGLKHVRDLPPKKRPQDPPNG